MEADDYPEFPTLEQLALDALRDAILSSHFAPPSLASRQLKTIVVYKLI